MKASDKIAALVEYWDSTRAAGHTRLLLNGVLNSNKCAVIGHDTDFAKILADLAPDVAVLPLTMENIDKLHGQRLPLAIDHFALLVLFIQVLGEMTAMRNSITALEQKVQHARRCLE
jgi:hypothetical protein